ncbi:type II toxin-antitoxin system Phd/YefM family antitoxin [Nocardiopsis sp. NPDC050513]|uniref:type II toxin-antitoxin system Phd/YefM family antitoxin n=1 Tax=Nocardiopsis sp. NPDC050513 TaxID=3364338 RepID=UPI0037B09D03
MREGHTITVTDHGKPIARIVPVGEHSTLDRLILEGQVTPARRAKRGAPARIKAGGTVGDLVGEQRR